ncbi:MAG: GGDEF domain-containing protein [Spirochaetia bacterium]|nr:GGDEF domain-containing protein [Spirochaetia bacterium]
MMFLFRTRTSTSIPGIISYLGVMFLLLLIKAFLDHERASRLRIEEQRKTLEESEQKLYRMAYYDTLTGLPNRESFFQEVSQHIGEAKRAGALLGVLFIDFDSFKSINDTAGHATGDRVLQKISQTLSSSLQPGDFLARYGGDEFLIQLGPQPTIEDFSERAQAILSRLRKPLQLGDDEYFLPASMGLAIYPLDGESVEELIRHADIAMYAAKTKGKNQLAFCTADMKASPPRRCGLPTASIVRSTVVSCSCIIRPRWLPIRKRWLALKPCCAGSTMSMGSSRRWSSSPWLNRPA